MMMNSSSSESPKSCLFALNLENSKALLLRYIILAQTNPIHVLLVYLLGSCFNCNSEKFVPMSVTSSFLAVCISVVNLWPTSVIRDVFIFPMSATLSTLTPSYFFARVSISIATNTHMYSKQFPIFHLPVFLIHCVPENQKWVVEKSAETS